MNTNDLKKKQIIEKYWLDKLSGHLPKISLSFLTDEDKKEADKTGKLCLEIPESQSADLFRMANHSDTAVFILFFAGLHVLLYHYTGMTDLVVGTVTPTREKIKEQLMICRNRLSPHAAFKDTINCIKENVLENFNHVDYIFGFLYQRLLEKQGPGAGTLDIFNVAFFYDGIQKRGKFLRQFDLVFMLSRQENRLVLEVDYNPALYAPGMVQRFSRNYINLFQDLPGKLDREISTIPVTSDRENEELSSFNRTGVEFAGTRPLHREFFHQVEKTPHAVALVSGDHFITYEELDKRANRLALYLKQRGVKPDSTVALLLEPSPLVVEAMLGVLKAGGAYVPIESSSPPNRIRYMLGECSASVVLTHSQLLEQHSFASLMNLQPPAGDNKAYLTCLPSQICDLDSLPIPDRSLVNYEKYNRYIGQAMVKHSIAFQGTRGCPLNCVYCQKIGLKKYVRRSPEKILEEMQLYYDMGVRRFVIIDDIFNLDRKTSSRFFESIVEKGLKVQLFFPNGLRGDFLTRDYIDLMVKAGTVNVALALETASPRLQKLIGKNLDLEKLEENIRYFCEKYPHVILELFTLHGIPGETEEEAMKTLEFVNRIKWIHFPYINLLKIYPNTQMEQIALEHGITKKAILMSDNKGWHEFSSLLPFDKQFTLKYQADFLNGYFLSKERLLSVLPHQMKQLTEDEIVQKYNSYLPVDIGSFDDLLNFAGIERNQLAVRQCIPEESVVVPRLNRKLRRYFSRYRQEPAKDALRILLLDMSQFFSSHSQMLYDVVEPPLGLMCILTQLNRQLGSKINGQIKKSRIDFDSYEELKQLLTQFKPHLVGIRTLTFYKDFFHRTAALIRQWGFTIPIVVGGPYATSDYATLLQDTHIDAAFFGEGEFNFTRLVEEMLKNEKKFPKESVLREIPGIAFVPDEEKNTRQFARHIVMLDQMTRVLEQTAGKKIQSVNRTGDLANIIFTSGSTGKPKGVLVEHNNLLNTLGWYGGKYRVEPGTHVLQLSNYTFDPSVEQIFGSLLHGASVFLVEKELRADNRGLRRFIETRQIHLINFVPGMLETILADDLKLESLRAVISGGERLEPSVKNKLLNRGYPLYNQYGPTETTIDAVSRKCTRDSDAIGQPIANVKCFIVNPRGNLSPIGVAGELFIAGPGVARGYLNRPELTTEKFNHDFWDYQANHSQKESTNQKLLRGRPDASWGGFLQKRPPGRRRQKIYKTGDLARWSPQGVIQFLGRKDHQVKIRGYRVELGEIEAQLLSHPNIHSAVAAVMDHTLCAYIVLKENITSAKTLPKKENISWVREYLIQELPDHMVPAHIMVLKENQLPLTAAGKVDRTALPAPGQIKTGTHTEYIAPRNHIEIKMTEIWQDVLGKNKIGIHDNYFNSGGDSIKSIQILSRMNAAGLKLDMKEIFRKPTIAQLSPGVVKIEQTAKSKEKTAVTGVFPLTPIQRKFFRDSRLYPHHFNQSVMFFSRERLDENIIKAIFTKIQEHHDALRMIFPGKNGEVIQENLGSQLSPGFRQYDLRSEENPAEMLETRANELQGSISLETGPLMKIALFHMQDGDRLLIVIHHLVVDGVSWRILFEDIGQLYRQAKAGMSLTLPPKTDSFKTWAEKLAVYANSPTFLAEKDFWRRVDAAAVPLIPGDINGKENLQQDADSLSFQLSETETRVLLTGVNHAFGTEVNDILLTGMGLGISRTFGHNCVAVALESHGREQILEGVDVSRTVGWFTALYPLVLDFSYQDQPARQIIKVKETLRQVPNRGIGWGILKYLTAPQHRKGLRFQPEPQVSFNYIGQFDTDVNQLDFDIAGETGGQEQHPREKRQFDLDFTGMVSAGKLVITITFSREQYKVETIQKLSNHYKTALSEVIAFCARQEKQQLTPADFTFNRISTESAAELQRRYEVEDLYPLTPLQEGMLFHSLVDESGATYFEQVSYRLQGKLEVKLVEKSLNRLVQRYEILRTAFVHEGFERPLQVVLKKRQVEFSYQDIRKTIADNQKENYIASFKEKQKQRRFDLSNDVLMRVAVIRLGDSDYEFTWNHHHILMDGWCLGILIADYFHIYNSYLENREPQLEPVTSFKTYIRWLESQDRERSRQYWRNYLQGYNMPAGVPKARDPESIKGYRKVHVNFQLDSDTVGALNRLAADSQVTINTVIQTIWGILLMKYNDCRDVVFSTVVSGRPEEIPGVESMVGLFINTIPVRIRCRHSMTFNELLANVQKEAIESKDHHYYPLADIQAETPLKQKLLDNNLVFANYPITQKLHDALQADLKVMGVDVFEQTHYNFSMLVGPGDPLHIEFVFNANVYDRENVEEIANHFKNVTQYILANENCPVKDIAILSENQKNGIQSVLQQDMAALDEELNFQDL